MELVVHGSRVVTDARTGNISAELDAMIFNIRHYNFGGSWRPRRNVDLFSSADLQNLRDIKDSFGSKIKIRIEDPYVQIYTEDQEVLREVAVAMNESLQSKIQSVTWPKDNEDLEILSSDKIIRKQKPEYKFKFMIRDGYYPDDVRSSIFNYLNSQDDVKLSAGTIRQFQIFNYLYGAFFYANDEKIATFLSIISPGFVRKIHELVHRPE
jgi:hypothetical protein